MAPRSSGSGPARAPGSRSAAASSSGPRSRSKTSNERRSCRARVTSMPCSARRSYGSHARTLQHSAPDNGSAMKRALITGITGQDGSYLAELLLAKGYEVHGLVRRSSSFNTERLDPIYQDPHTADYRLRLVYGDLEDGSSLANLIARIAPDEIYNLGAQSHVRVSFDMPEYTASTVAIGTLRLLEAIRALGLKCRFYQASSSEMFGAAPAPQHERTAFMPRSPYACAKVFAHQLC